MKVFKTISIETEDALKIDIAIQNGEANNVSDLIQKALSKYLRNY